MGQVAIGRVIAGGLLAGLIINASQFVFNMFVVGPQLDEAMKAMNLPPIGGQAIGVFVVLCFGIGIVAVWLYAAVRPRFGPGVATAVKVGVAVWLLAYVYQGVAQIAMGMFPPAMMILGLGWGLVEDVVATIAGAWLYTEMPARRAPATL